MPFSFNTDWQSSISDDTSVEIRIRNGALMALAQLGRTVGFFKLEGRHYVLRTIVREGVIISEDFIWILRRVVAGGAKILFVFRAKAEEAKLIAWRLQLPEALCLSTNEAFWAGWDSRAAWSFSSTPKFPRSRQPT